MRNILIGLIAYLGLCGIALAQSTTYPTKSVRLLVGTPPGGGTDVTARIIAEKLRELLAILRAIGCSFPRKDNAL